MTIATLFWNYQDHPPATTRRSCSPALLALMRELRLSYNVTNLGCYGVRDIRGGDKPSTHAYGAAIDVSWANESRDAIENGLIPWLIGFSEEWGIQAVHDYVGCRIWRAGRTPHVEDACSLWWKAQRPDTAGMGKSWATHLHIEVHPARWDDPRSWEDRYHE